MPMNNRLMRPKAGRAGPGAATHLLLHFNSATPQGLAADSSQYNRQLVSYDGTPSRDELEGYDFDAQPLLFSGVGSKFGANGLNLQGPFGIQLGENRNILPDLSQEDHTIECWVYYPASEQGMITATIAHFPTTENLTSTEGQHLYIAGEYVFFNNGVAGAVSTENFWEPIGVPVGQWFHLAAVQQGTCKRIFINGQLRAVATQPAPVGPCSLSIGAYAYDDQQSGDFGITVRLYNIPAYPIYIDELRILYGVAAYSANFTPPAAPFSSDPPSAPSLNCCPPAGLALSTQCIGDDAYVTFSDGLCGTVQTLVGPGACA